MLYYTLTNQNYQVKKLVVSWPSSPLKSDDRVSRCKMVILSKITFWSDKSLNNIIFRFFTISIPFLNCNVLLSFGK